jgi:hypothetical protein
MTASSAERESGPVEESQAVVSRFAFGRTVRRSTTSPGRSSNGCWPGITYRCGVSWPGSRTGGCRCTGDGLSDENEDNTRLLRPARASPKRSGQSILWPIANCDRCIAP